ncbi:Double Clp-N motif-containing P-loop nucleoside triphosphate hydrolases superfamily protein [Striga hermonthica]|uniref:Double Clp-N motif-containing P-loop nucleoside triphosphate hydrolases superfamily protein n=1 Tax=Striga hermonthica TaxID=68872 RepID=A0A9N7R3H5_STRHE|nr:Double Clp-N motif-containing P-loop nucleoside triphosphate hydrolases superfamily protein [Striga hermonthica]
MRAGLNTIQQTLTPEAAAVLNQSIAEASRRNHGQTTPLHVAAMLLASPSGFLRQACIRSHPNSSHPLQCRALELCFSVALERLPTAQSAGDAEPPISNALMAALKRAQAHQRRGCPEQQQQPLLAVKVELEQLVISILDDPGVSRVMREASFSSPAVKATIEQSLNSSSSRASQRQHHVAGGSTNFVAGFGGIASRMLPNPGQPPTPVARPMSPAVPSLANRSLFLNPHMQQQQTPTAQIENPRGEEVKKVFDIMSRSKKRNPVIVGDSDPEAVAKELLSKIENNELGNDLNMKNLQIISIDKSLLLSDKNQIATKIDEYERAIESKIGNGGVILDLGDLRWLVEQPAAAGFSGAQKQQKAPVVSELGRALVVEMSKLLARFSGADGLNEGKNKLWLIGTATCETYLRCQVYHPTMESDWDLQAVPITSRSPVPGMFPSPLPGLSRLIPENSNPAQRHPTPSPLPGLARLVPENSDPAQKPTFCPQCSVNYEKDLAKIAAIEKSLSRAKQDNLQSTLPVWLQNAKLNNPDAKTTNESQGNDQILLSKQKTQELQKKWRDTCMHLHPNFHQNTLPENPVRPAVPSLAGIYNPNSLAHPPLQPIKPNLSKPLGSTLKLNTGPVTTQLVPPATPKSPLSSPVLTDLVLGTKGLEKPAEDHPAKDLLSCISSEPMTTNKPLEKFADELDASTYKKLLKGLMENAWWQAEAASAVASAITRCRLGNGKQRGSGRGDTWLLFAGPDRVAKRKMASVLAEQICGSGPLIIGLGAHREDEPDTGLRGRTAVDRIAEAVRRNPTSVIVLRDIDEADVIARGNIKRAIDRGRINDAHGREVGLGNAVFIVTGDWSTVSAEALRDGQFVDERKLNSTAGGSWQLGLIVREKTAKRRANWTNDGGPRSRPRTETGSSGGLSLDLNLSATAYEEKSVESSEVSAVDGGDDAEPTDGGFSIVSLPHDLASCVDDSIVFRPVEAAFVRREIKKTIAVKFSMDVDENLKIEIGDDVLDKILGGLWHDSTSLEKWVEGVVGPSFEELKPRLPAGDRSNSVVRLVVESDSCDRGKSKGDVVDWLPSSILV